MEICLLSLSLLRRCWITLASIRTKLPRHATGGYLVKCTKWQTTDIIIIQFPTNLFSHLDRVSYPEYLHLSLLLLLHVAVDVAAGDAGLRPGLVSQDILLEELEQSRWNIHHLLEVSGISQFSYFCSLFIPQSPSTWKLAPRLVEPNFVTEYQARLLFWRGASRNKVRIYQLNAFNEKLGFFNLKVQRIVLDTLPLWRPFFWNPNIISCPIQEPKCYNVGQSNRLPNC